MEHRQPVDGRRPATQGIPKVSFGMIMLNGPPFLPYDLCALYPFAQT